MARTLSILVFAAAVLAAVAVIILSGPVVAVVPALGLAAAVFLFLERHRSGYVAGSILAVASVAGLLMALGGISTEGGAFGTASAETGQAMAIASGIVAAGALLGFTWTRLTPPWMPLVWLVVLLAALGLTVVSRDAFGEPTEWMNYVVGGLVVAGGVPALLQAIRPLD